MKLEWKRQEKEIYGVNTKPCGIDIPAQCKEGIQCIW